MGDEIRRDHGSGGLIVPVIYDIAESLIYEERERLRPWRDDKLAELQGIANCHCIFEDLRVSCDPLDRVLCAITVWTSNETLAQHGLKEN